MTPGGKAFPSYVTVTADGQMLVGEPARRHRPPPLPTRLAAEERKLYEQLRVLGRKGKRAKS